MAASREPQGLTLTVLGCGTMGIAIMGGVMSSLAKAKTQAALDPAAAPQHTPDLRNFVACDTWAPAEANVKKALAHYNFPLQTLTNDNLQGVQAADLVLLACKPHGYKHVLGEHGIRAALRGKVLVSILAGVSQQQIEDFLYPEGVATVDGACRIVRVMPNTASFVGESMSVIQTSTPPLSQSQHDLVSFVFSSIGRVVTLPPAQMDISTALCGSGPAFFALILEAAADGAVAMGLPRAEAQLMAAQTMRGTTGLVLNGEHPAVLKDKVSTPGGCTIGGLMSLEEDGVRGSIAKAIREACVVASRLGGEQRDFVNHRR
ncbi:delta 1-pyrroline-5-carboxylate reductase [Pleosporales sp. CAS-2024a]